MIWSLLSHFYSFSYLRKCPSNTQQHFSHLDFS
jgi:hypothetical protein